MKGIPLTPLIAQQLCARVSQIERINAEVVALQDKKRGIYAEVVSLGACKVSFRRVMRRREMTPEELVDDPYGPDPRVKAYEEYITAYLDD